MFTSWFVHLFPAGNGTTTLPTGSQVVPVVSLNGHEIAGIACGPFHTFAWSAAQHASIGTRLPYCLNVSCSEFKLMSN